MLHLIMKTGIRLIREEDEGRPVRDNTMLNLLR